MIKVIFIIIIINLFGCNGIRDNSKLILAHSSKNQNLSYSATYLSANYSISKGDAYTASKLLNAKSNHIELLQLKFISNLVSGNFAYAINFASTIPQFFEDSQNVDFLFFIDAANIWGVDYDNSLDDSGSIRSSTGVALDWFSPIGPLNFSLAYPITKENGDKEETFRFNLGTSF